MTLPELKNKVAVRSTIPTGTPAGAATYGASTASRRVGPLQHATSCAIEESRRSNSLLASQPAWSTFLAVLALLRPLHWAKNLLLFVPFFLAHEFTDVKKVVVVFWAFVAFSLSASAGYVANDLLDLASDRGHGSKRRRPLAAGKLSAGFATCVMGGLLLLAVFVSFVSLPWQFLAIMLGYFVLSLSYSLVLKKRAILDVVTLASLYTLRLVAGGIAAATVASSWLLAFAVFFFASLAFVKRYVELDQTELSGDAKLLGRGYQPGDRQFLASVGPMCGAISVLVLALYMNSPVVAQLYTRPGILWLTLPLVFYWILRVWLLAQRGQLHEDPVVFAVTDRASVSVAILSVVVVLTAI